MKTQNPIQTFMLHVSPSHLSNPQTPFPLAPGMLRRFTLIQFISQISQGTAQASRLGSGILQDLKLHEMEAFKHLERWFQDRRSKSFSQKGGVMCSKKVSSHHDVQSEAVACLVRLWLRSWIWQEVIQGTSIEISRHFNFNHRFSHR